MKPPILKLAGDRLTITREPSSFTGVQFANKLGYRTVAIAGPDKEALACKLGAHVYIDSSVENVSNALGRLGGARTVLVTEGCC
jgi:D-arabinose 1-dehydrogenase-like Zn-dependent alcohol dehydrogenase